MRAELRKGWCPTALRPMMSGDGLLVRLGGSASILTPQTARALADIAQRCGNGLLDLTSRGHLQFRGVTDASLLSLHMALDDFGLLEFDDEPAATIMTSPLAGIDPNALIDSRPLVASLRARLLATPTMSELPPKFFFAIDEGGSSSIGSEKADIGFVPMRFEDGATRFIISLGGMRAGVCALDNLPNVALRLAQVFLDLRGSGGEPERRMAALGHRVGAVEILDRASVAKLAGEFPSPKPQQPIGRFQLRALHVLGVGLPFGRLDSATLRLLADVAEKSNGELRLTPWRSVLIIGDREPEAAAALANAGLILVPDDPLRAVAACPGAPGCANGTTPTQADARRLAFFARQMKAQGIVLHVSGCEKGCAHAGPARITLVGRDGAYDIVIDRRADDSPIRRGLRVDDVERALHDLIAAPASASP